MSWDMIDFTELPKDGTAFEQLVRELMLIADMRPHWSGKGPDQGRDIIITEVANGPLAIFERRWLVQCKHYAHSGKSVGRDDLGSIVDDCRQVGAEGYLLACTTQPSAGLITKLSEIQNQPANNIVTTYWDAVDIERRIREPRSFALGHLFFPRSFEATPWQVYNDGSPNRWTANYKDYFFHLCSRISGKYPDLAECEIIVDRLESISIGPGERVRPRAIYFDDKHEEFTVFADYLVPSDSQPQLKPSHFQAHLLDGTGLHSGKSGSWYATYWDVELRKTWPLSDHFHVDHYDYYVPYRGTYQIGMARDKFISEKSTYTDRW